MNADGSVPKYPDTQKSATEWSRVAAQVLLAQKVQNFSAIQIAVQFTAISKDLLVSVHLQKSTTVQNSEDQTSK